MLSVSSKGNMFLTLVAKDKNGQKESLSSQISKTKFQNENAEVSGKKWIKTVENKRDWNSIRAPESISFNSKLL
jgi:hypothetical protein